MIYPPVFSKIKSKVGVYERDHLKFLQKWRYDPIRVPLLIRGARQVGKSWLVNLFGNEFDSFIEINFEKDRRVHALFPSHILPQG